MATNAVVSVDMIAVLNAAGQQELLRKGAELPEYVDEKKVKELQAAGLVEAKRKSRARSSSKDEEKAPPKSAEGDPFDPSKENQDKVLEYLAGADDAEVARVKAAEAKGQDRQKIAAFGVNE